MRILDICPLFVTYLVTAFGASHTFPISAINHILTPRDSIDENSNNGLQTYLRPKYDGDHGLLRRSPSSIQWSETPSSRRVASSRRLTRYQPLSSAVECARIAGSLNRHSNPQSGLMSTSQQSSNHSKLLERKLPSRLDIQARRDSGVLTSTGKDPRLYARASTDGRGGSPDRPLHSTTLRLSTQSPRRQNSAPYPRRQQPPTSSTRVYLIRPLTVETLAEQQVPNGRSHETNYHSRTATQAGSSPERYQRTHSPQQGQLRHQHSSSSISLSTSSSSTSSIEVESHQRTAERRPRRTQVPVQRDSQEEDSSTPSLTRRDRSPDAYSGTTVLHPHRKVKDHNHGNNVSDLETQSLSRSQQPDQPNSTTKVFSHSSHAKDGAESNKKHEIVPVRNQSSESSSYAHRLLESEHQFKHDSAKFDHDTVQVRLQNRASTGDDTYSSKLIRRGPKKSSKANSRSSSTQSLQSIPPTRGSSSNLQRAFQSPSTSPQIQRSRQQLPSSGASSSVNQSSQGTKKRRTRRRSSKSPSQNQESEPEPATANTSPSSPSSRRRQEDIPPSLTSMISRLSPIRTSIEQKRQPSRSSPTTSTDNQRSKPPTPNSSKSYFSADSDFFVTPLGSSRDSQVSPFMASPRSTTTQNLAQRLSIAPSPFSNARPAASTSVPGSPFHERARPFHNAHSRSYSAPVSMTEEPFPRTTQSAATHAQSNQPTNEPQSRKPSQDLSGSPSPGVNPGLSPFSRLPSSPSPDPSPPTTPKQSRIGQKSGQTSPSIPQTQQVTQSATATAPNQQPDPYLPPHRRSQALSQAPSLQGSLPRAPSSRASLSRASSLRAPLSQTLSRAPSQQIQLQAPVSRVSSLLQLPPQAAPQNLGAAAYQALRSALDPIVSAPGPSPYGPVGSPARGSPVRGSPVRGSPAYGRPAFSTINRGNSAHSSASSLSTADTGPNWQPPQRLDLPFIRRPSPEDWVSPSDLKEFFLSERKSGGST